MHQGQWGKADSPEEWTKPEGMHPPLINGEETADGVVGSLGTLEHVGSSNGGTSSGDRRNLSRKRFGGIGPTTHHPMSR